MFSHLQINIWVIDQGKFSVYRKWAKYLEGFEFFTFELEVLVRFFRTLNQKG